MAVFQKKMPEPDGSAALGASDPRLTPTPDYGALGPDSDFAKLNSASSSAAPSASGDAATATVRGKTGVNPRVLQIAAALGGCVSALLVGATGRIAGRGSVGSGVSPQKNSAGRSVDYSVDSLDAQRSQKQAEILLSRAVNKNDGATEQIQTHVEAWRGKIQWDAKLSELTTVALNSNDQSVRASAIEVQLAAYGLAKSPSTVDGLVRQAESSDHAHKIWALWSLGLLGNRGVETDRVVEVLTSELKGAGRDSNEDSRRWAVEALALVGTDSTIAPLLDAMHNDASPLVRERAACSLAESGMLTHEQRLTAVPQLIAYSDDPALDAQTHGWAFQALGDITKQQLPRDSAAWRNWYRSQ